MALALLLRGSRRRKRFSAPGATRGTYMISVRLQVLPTGLISMLSYLFGLM